MMKYTLISGLKFMARKGVDMNDLLTLKCKICHRDYGLNTANRKLYETQVVQENSVCPLCESKVKRVSISLTCSKCKHLFKTKILLSNQNKYGLTWECPQCTSNSLPQPKITEEKKDCVELNCDDCRLERGVCCQPELACSLSKNFARFDTGGLFYLRDGATILSVHAIDKNRKDVHCLKHTLLYRKKYAIASRNRIVVRQRLGSKKTFVTNIIVYGYNAHEHKFNVVFDEKFKKGTDWIVPTRNFLLK